VTGEEKTQLEVLEIEISGQRYGLPTSDIIEIVRAATLIKLPKVPPIVEGIVNFHGKVVPVLDVRKRFRLPAKQIEHTDHLIVARAGSRLVALRADRALEILRLDRADIADTAKVAPNAQYVTGVAKLPDGLLLIHDLRAFLSHEESDAIADSLSGFEPEAPKP
jgi:purine-binding chemotaxis protein CheW